MAEKKETKVKEEKKTTAKPAKEKAVKEAKKAEAKAEKKTKAAPAKTTKAKKEKAFVVPETSMKLIHLKPLITEKAVMLLEAGNVLTFETSMKLNKNEIKREVESIFEAQVESIRTLIRKSKKYAYVKLNPKTPAMDIATKLGMI